MTKKKSKIPNYFHLRYLVLLLLLLLLLYFVYPSLLTWLYTQCVLTKDSPTHPKMDSFIDSALELLEAYPSATVSITYSRVGKKESLEESRRPSNKVKFKVHDLVLTKSVRYTTTKTKELSKLLTFLGPHGVSTKRKAAQDLLAAKKLKPSPGVAGVMSNFKAKELPIVQQNQAAESESATKEDDLQATASKKKGKKKGKKK